MPRDLRSAPASTSPILGSPSLARDHLTEWIRGTVGDDVQITWAAPDNTAPTTRGVGLHLTHLRVPEAPVGHKLPQLQLSASYLVTTSAPDLLQAQDDLCLLGFAALEAQGMQADFTPMPDSVWLAYGATPRPCFTITLPLRKACTLIPRAPLVRTAPTITPVPISPLKGQVLGPDDTPIVDARIDIVNMNRSTQTGADGRFVLPGVPMDRALTLRVRARGGSEQFHLSASVLGEGPLSLRMTLS